MFITEIICGSIVFRFRATSTIFYHFREKDFRLRLSPTALLRRGHLSAVCVGTRHSGHKTPKWLVVLNTNAPARRSRVIRFLRTPDRSNIMVLCWGRIFSNNCNTGKYSTDTFTFTTTRWQTVPTRRTFIGRLKYDIFGNECFGHFVLYLYR